MRLSVALPKPSREPVSAIAECIETARLAEESGAHAVSATDHPFPRPDGAVSHQAHDPFTLLAHLAALTEHVRLHFSLLVAGHRNPFLAARMIATLDAVSHGRVIVGVGAGYHVPELEALGAPTDARGRRLAEAVTAMKAAWTGRPLHLDHADWPATGNLMLPRPVQRPHPPLWRGGNSSTAMRSVPRGFDGWTPMEVNQRWAAEAGTTGLTLTTIGPAVRRLQDEWARAGRDGAPTVCLVRSRTDWVQDADRVVTEVGQLKEAGVTWVEIAPAGESSAERLACIESVTEMLAIAGLLDPR